MGYRLKKSISVLLAFLQVVLILSACSSGAQSKSKNESSKSTSSGTITPKEYTIEDKSIRYSSRSIEMPTAGIFLDRAVKSRDGVFMFGRDENRNASYFSYSIEDSLLSPLDSFGTQLPESIAASPNGSLHALFVDEAGNHFISSVSADGVLSRVPLELGNDNDSMVFGFYATDTGFVLELSSRTLAMNTDGKVIQDYGLQYGATEVVAFSDKTLLVQTLTQDGAKACGEKPGTVITELKADFSFGQSYQAETQFSGFYPGANNQLFGVMKNSIYSYDPTSGHSVALVNALASNMDTRNLVCLSDGLYFTLQDGFPYLWQPSTDDSITVLNLATYKMSFDMQQAIKAFNASGSSYVINTIDYAIYDEYNSANVGMNRFATDIITGTVPDIFDMSFLSSNNLASKGLLENIKPYFDADASISYDDLLPCVSKNAEFMGGLYQLIPSFNIVAVCGNASVTGKAPSSDNLLSLAEVHGSDAVFGPDYTKSNFLADVLCFMKKDLYSEEDLECNFISDSFISMLEFAKTLPSSFIPDGTQGEPMGRSYAGEQLLVLTNLGCSAASEISLLNAIFGGNAQFVGFPANSGNGVGIRPWAQLGMSSSSVNKNGVWEFFKFLLSDPVQLNAGIFGGLPSVSSCYTKMQSNMISHAIEKVPSAYGVSLEGPVHFLGIEVNKTEMTQTMNTLIDRADCIMSYETAILDIILLCAEPYFAGEKTAEEAAAATQSRASIYLAEQYG